MTTVKISIPFESLVAAINSLSREEQSQLLEILEDRLFEAEEDLEESPDVLTEVQAAREAYQAGDYQTIEDYLVSRSD